MSIISPLPNTLVNGTPMDAPQVMADFNQIYNDVNNNAAHSGVNADITQLTNLSTPLSVSQGGTGVGTAPLGLNYADGQVQVSVSASTVTVTPFDGGNLVINGTQRSLSAPFSVTPATAASTTYYVYVAMDVVPTATVEISTTAWTLDSFGRKNKTGDATRRLVGMVRTDAAGNFGNTSAFRGCLNYFVRRALPFTAAFSGNTASNTFVNATNTVTALVWGDESVIWVGTLTATQSVIGGNTVSTAFIDGVAAGSQPAVAAYASAANVTGTFVYSAILTEGAHTFGCGVRTTGAGTLTIGSGSSGWGITRG